MKKKFAVGLGLLAGGIIGAGKTANAVVYIGDPSIDTYKQKTDQTFYDMYQNPQSAMGKQVQSIKPARQFFNSIPTGNRVAEGNYLNRVQQGTLEGGQLPNGAWAWITILGDRYKIVATANGLKLYNKYGGLQKTPPEKLVVNNDWKRVTDTLERGTGTKAIFIPASGDLFQYGVTVERTRPKHTYKCGKSTCVKYGAWSQPKVVEIHDVKVKHYNLAKAIMQGGINIDISHDKITQYGKTNFNTYEIKTKKGTYVEYQSETIEGWHPFHWRYRRPW